VSKKRGSGEGSIYEESPGKWVASITAGYEFKDGRRRRVRKKFSAPTRREVADKLTAALRDQQTGVGIAPKSLTVGQFLNSWLDSVVPMNTKPKTATFYRYMSEVHLIPAIGKIQLQKLSQDDVQALINSKLTETSLKTKKTLSRRTVKHMHRTLATALQVAVERGKAHRNVAALVEPVTAPKAKASFLTVEQARAMIAECEGKRLGVLFTTILALGLRLGEAIGLSWEDVDLDAGELRIRYTLQRVNGEFARLTPKTKESDRAIELPGFIVTALRKHRENQQAAREWAGDRWQDDAWDLVFRSSRGTPLDERNVLRQFQEGILAPTGLPKMRIHDLRHSAVAILHAQGVEPYLISKLLGHCSVSFTQDVYGHIFKKQKREVANQMESALSPPVSIPVAPSLAPSRRLVRVK
jgi:integrase